MESNSTISIPVSHFENGKLIDRMDILAIEEPLDIKINFLSGKTSIEKTISITMRTPGNDDELAIGFLFTEGIINSEQQIKSIGQSTDNTILIEFQDFVIVNENKLERNFYTTSSCGVCGKTSIDAIKSISGFEIKTKFSRADPKLILSLPEKLSLQQEIFKSTGGLHASALFNSNGELIDLREDVGRHNALDKLIGTLLMRNQLPLSNTILLLSGRASFELIQKASMCGIPIVAAIGAPSSLAVELAKEVGISLIGFLKKDKYNLYC